MIPLSINLNGDNAWPDLAQKVVTEATQISLAMLDGGMSSGKPSITIRIDLPNGRVVLAQTSARLFCTAARAVMAKHPDLFDD
jgi:hypothetical protein